jgi:ABC-type uncharacterized transport system substrate-binding protein
MAACFCGSRWGCQYCAAQALYLSRQFLNGVKPAAISFDQPIKFDFIINLKAAKQIGLRSREGVLAKAGISVK